MRRFIASFTAAVLFITGVLPLHIICGSCTDIPEISAKAAVLISADTGEIIFEKDCRKKLPMASTTKIMTVLLTIESGGLDEEFVVDSEAIKVEGSSMGLCEGDIVTKYALCVGMLLPSGNDAANAAAVRVAGSIPAFADMMNRKARELGLSHTYFVTPSGLEVKGHTVGIIGFGNMGGAFAQRLQGFDCKIVAYDKYKPAGYAPSYVEEVSLAELQQRADILSLHVPLTDETHYMVDEMFIERMHKSFYLINTSRGAVVKTAALAKAIEQGKALGAALDVIEYEDMTKDGIDIQSQPADFRYLLESPRTVLTPHVAGWTVESKYKLAAVLADKIIDTLC